MKHLTTDQLISFQLNELSSKESIFIEQHLNQCVKCQNELILIGELQDEWMNPPSVNLSIDVINEIMVNTDLINSGNQKDHGLQKKVNSKKVRFVHVLLAAAATFIFFQFQLTKHISKSNKQVVQTIEQTSTFIDKSERVKITIPKIWDVIKK